MDLLKLGFILIFLGFITAFVGVLIPILLTLLEPTKVGIGVGGCIVVFFIPICFGYGEPAVPMMIIMLVLALALIIVSFLMFRAIRKTTHVKNVEEYV